MTVRGPEFKSVLQSKTKQPMRQVLLIIPILQVCKLSTEKLSYTQDHIATVRGRTRI
jgi:hypothetical protein